MVPCLLRSAALLFAIATLLSAAGSTAPQWLKIESPNFQLFTTASERSGRDVVRHFEQVRAFFVQAMHLTPQAPVKVRIVFFKTDKEYAPYAPNDFSDAFYLGAEDHDYIVMKSSQRDQFPVAVHEYTHLLVKHTAIPAPVWFNEGLAELYSNLKPIAGRIEVGDLIAGHMLVLRQQKWIDLSTLLAVQPDSPLYNKKVHAGVFYAESWALVHMLYLGAQYRPNTTQLLSALKDHADMPQTFEKIYGKPLAQIQKDLQAYLLASTFNASLFPIKLEKDVDSPEVTDSSSLEAGLVLAEMLSNLRDKAADARAMYQKLALENPKDWQAELGLARLSQREAKRDDALAHFSRAAELGATDSQMYLDYGRLLLTSGKRAEATAILKRATEVEPGNREAHLELAYTYLSYDRNADALAQLLLVKKVTPGQAFAYFHALAYIYYRLDRKAEAKTAAADSRKFARDSAEIAQVDSLDQVLNSNVPALSAGDPLENAYQSPPQLRRRGPSLAVAEGTLQQIECVGGKIRMHIGIGPDAMKFGILDPASVTMKDNAPMEFTCGPQKPRRIRVEYEARQDVMPGTLGIVRTIAFPE